MARSSESYHEAREALSEETRDLHRALTSLQEELEAVDWYQQRIDAARDDELKRILAHNRDEEKEHAAMILEWLRRRDADFERVLRMYLFSSGDIVNREAAIEGKTDAEDAATVPAGLTVGSLLKQKQ